MKQFIFTTLCLLVSLCGYGQTAMVEVTHSKPYQYEKRNGQLQIQATVHLPGTHPPGIQVWLDGKPVEVANASDNKLTVWLPLIGEDKLLQIASGKQKKMIAEQLYTPPDPAKLGLLPERNNPYHLFLPSGYSLDEHARLVQARTDIRHHQPGHANDGHRPELCVRYGTNPQPEGVSR